MEQKISTLDIESCANQMKLLLIDGHYYAYRSFYAIRQLTNSKGKSTNMLYGYAKALKRMMIDIQPDLMAVIMDGGLPAERMAVQSDYKANRSETPAEMVEQFPYLDRLVPALGIPYLEVEGEEADDVIASYVTAVQGQGVEVIIATNDKDIMQMVGPSTFIYQPGSEGFTLLDAAGVEEKWGVPPEKVGQVLILTGDSVDNIPGVPGIGPKTAASLIRQFGSVDVLMQNLGEVKSEKQRTALEQSRELLQRNRTMVGLRTGVKLPKDWRELKLEPDFAGQVELFRELEFKTLLKEAEVAWSKQPKSGEETKLGQQELF